MGSPSPAGRLRPRPYHGPMATLTEIAKQAGVPVPVASRLLNGDPTVRAREETRQRVLQVAKDLNYSANYAGRALRLARSKALALVIPTVSSPLFADLLQGAEDAAEAEDYTLLIGHANRLTRGSDTAVQAAVAGGNGPDVAFVPSPATLQSLAAAGKLQTMPR